MTIEIYERLAEALDKLPNGFPRAPSNVEIPIPKKIFSPDNALSIIDQSEKEGLVHVVSNIVFRDLPLHDYADREKARLKYRELL